ncbi:MAG: hypothetical protein RIQ55_272 [Pseudomonadota bacterium]|jgi:nitronate monooxygenase
MAIANASENDHYPHILPSLLPLLQRGGLKPLHIGQKKLLPIVQGGMGVGVSAHSLAGTVAACGGIGTIASVDLRHLHPDLAAQTRRARGETGKAQIEAANQEALRREIRVARTLSQGRGIIAVNVMKALSAYQDYVATALQEGADALVVGAGLPLDLPDLAADYPNVALIPILSDARGVKIILKKWARANRLPAAIVIEHPGYAGGHLGAASVGDLHDARFDFEIVIPETLAVLRELGLEDQVPIIAAGGIRSHGDIQRMQSLGAAAAQLGTAFAVTAEGDASLAFKEILAGAREQDMVEFISVAGLPARAVKTPWLAHYLEKVEKLQARAKEKAQCIKSFDCLAHCGLRDGNGKVGQFCIDHQLTLAYKGEGNKGLFFRGVGDLPFGNQIRSVRDLITTLLSSDPDLCLQS